MNNWACLICSICKGARHGQYRVEDKSKLTKTQLRAAQRLKHKLKVITTEPPGKPPDPDPGCTTVIAGSIKPTDDFHIDFGYSIATSNKKEKYFLLVCLQDKDFMWTFPSTTRAAQELLLQDFVDLTGIVPATI
eukprot:296936-Rhodomonas_salina.1